MERWLNDTSEGGMISDRREMVEQEKGEVWKATGNDDATK